MTIGFLLLLVSVTLFVGFLMLVVTEDYIITLIVCVATILILLGRHTINIWGPVLASILLIRIW